MWPAAAAPLGGDGVGHGSHGEPWPATGGGDGHGEPSQPATPPDLLAAEQLVASDRTYAGGRYFTWPDQGGDVAPRSPHMLLHKHGADVKNMQAAMEEVLKLMVMTDLHLEAAMGRNLGNTLCTKPHMLLGVVEDMTLCFSVPYSLHNTLDVFACMANW